MVTGIDLLPEELIAIQPEELKNAIILVAILFGLLNVLVDLYWKLRRFRSDRKFWIRYLTKADENLEFAVSSFNWFILTPARLHFKLFLLCYLLFFALFLTPLYFGFIVPFLVALLGVLFITILVCYTHKKLENTISLKFSDILIKKLRRLIRYSLILRYLSYGIILFMLSFLIVLTTTANISLQGISDILAIVEKYSIVLTLSLLIILISMSSIILSRKSQKITIDFLRKKLNEYYVSKPEVTVYTEIESGKVSGRLTDIFDNSVLTLEDEGGQKFFIPWKSIDFLAVKSADSVSSDAKEEVTESLD